MTFLNSIYISIYQLIVLFGVIKIIGNVTYTTRDYISILGIVIPSTLLYFIFSTRIILILIVFTLIFMYIRNKFLGLVFVVLTFLLLYISNFFSVWTMALLIKL
jgi:two-component system sensor histidine kinase AgrC